VCEIYDLNKYMYIYLYTKDCILLLIVRLFDYDEIQRIIHYIVKDRSTYIYLHVVCQMIVDG